MQCLFPSLAKDYSPDYNSPSYNYLDYIAMLIDRERELETLERRYASEQAELFVLYGRRRVGKTELLRAFCRNKRHIFYVADLGTEATALAEFTRRISDFAYGRPDAISPFTSWDAAFEFLVPYAYEERLVVVMDEFTYLIQINPAIPSILQRLWDTRLKETRIMLVLCGSYVGMMEQHVLGYRAPLYGRRTGQWKLTPLDFWAAQAFFSRLGTEDRVRAFAVFGGVPAYLTHVRDATDLMSAVEQQILTPGTFLYEEPRFLLLEELRDPHRYFAVLEAIAGGKTRHNEIAQAAGITPTSLGFYLDTLQEMDLVERVTPATVQKPHKYRRALYRIKDHFFRFWFRFVYPNRSLLDGGDVAYVRQHVERFLDEFTAPVFEDMARQYILRLHRTGRMRWVPERVGAWWDGKAEIDVVAINFRGGHLLLGECKWSTRPVGMGVLQDLMNKAKRLSPERWQDVTYVLFSRTGFTHELQRYAEAAGHVLLIDLEELAKG